jgi:hypothetical protein
MTQTKVEAPFVEGGGGSSFKNLLINGDMQIWQRGTAATAATSAYVGVDRWKILENSEGAITAEQSALSTADKATTGCRNALLIKCTTADTSIASSQYSYISQALEGQFLSHLAWGTTSAKTLTLSFWVKAYVAATYTIFIKKYDNTDYYIPIEYAVNSSNTWEKKTIVISPTSGSTSLITGANGAFDQDNGIALLLGFGLTWGSTYHGTSGTWATGAHFSTSNQTNFLSSTDNTFYITGVQLEVGDQATDLEQVPFDIQLHRCQRYYENGFDTGYYPAADVNYDNMANTFQATCYAVDTLRCMIPFKTRKRTVPAVVTYRVDGLGDGSGDSGRWDMYDSGQGNWQQMDGTTSTGEATEYGVDLNFVDTNFELQESFIVAGGWEADAEI